MYIQISPSAATNKHVIRPYISRNIHLYFLLTLILTLSIQTTFDVKMYLVFTLERKQNQKYDIFPNISRYTRSLKCIQLYYDSFNIGQKLKHQYSDKR